MILSSEFPEVQRAEVLTTWVYFTEQRKEGKKADLIDEEKGFRQGISLSKVEGRSVVGGELEVRGNESSIEHSLSHQSKAIL